MLKKLITLTLLSGSFMANAGIVIIGTRVIYPAEQKSVGVQIKNIHNTPALAQVWLENTNGETDNIPFTLMPPVSRIEGKTSQTIRIRHLGTALPQDRETLFYFNLLDIPPKISDSHEQHNIQLSVQSKLKFFYRPTKLPYSTSDAYAKVTWHLSGQTLTVKNPTPYYITYSYASLNKDKQRLVEIDDVDMLAPFSEKSYTVKKAAPQANQVEWFIINDYGGDYGNVSPLQR